MNNQQITDQIKAEVAAQFTHNEPKPPEGYLPLEVIRGGLFHWIFVPFNGTKIWCQLRCLNATQLNACGAVTLVEVMKNKDEKLDMDKVIDIRNIQEKIVRETLNNPTFEQIETMIFAEDNVMAKHKKELDEIEKIDKSSLTPEQKKETAEHIERLRLYTGFVLPEDTFAFLTSWGLGLDVSDIKKLTEDQLLEAAILATRGNDNPHDHITGSFTDRDISDIDKCAWAIHGDFMHRKQIEHDAFNKRGA